MQRATVRSQIHILMILAMFLPYCPAKAVTPFVQSLDRIPSFQLALPKLFDPLHESLAIALDLEDEEIQAKLLQEAKNYIDFRMTRDSETFSKMCAAPQENENPFCLYEATRTPRATARNKHAIRDDRRKVTADLKSAHLEHLNRYSTADLSAGLRAFDDYAPLMGLAKKITDSRECQSSALSASLGYKAEEFFPDAAYIDLARGLYRRTSECSDEAHENTNAVKARFRLALIDIWQNNCTEADSLLSKLEGATEASAILSRVRYWRFHCANVSGNLDLRAETKEALFRHHPMSFQNIAANGDDQRLQLNPLLPETLMMASRSLFRPEMNNLIRATEALIRLGNLSIAADWLDNNANSVSKFEPEVRLYIAFLADRTGNSLPKFKILSSLFDDAPRMLSATALKMFFPLSFYDLLKEQSKELDPLLLISLIRQESAFNRNARSIVGARGLMQVMPATARSIASVSRGKLYDPKVNIRVGTKYFRRQLDQYNGDVELTLAAYNAGFARVDQWMKRYPVGNKLLFIDLMPYKETRDYVTTIMRNYYWYVKLYSNEPYQTQFESAPKLNTVPAKVLAIMSGHATALAQ